MGFAETIEDAAPAAYRKYYLNYTELKDLVLDLAKHKQNEPKSRFRTGTDECMDVNDKPVTKFQELLSAELQKVNQFACIKKETLFLELRRVCDECQSVGVKIKQNKKAGSANVSSVAADLVRLEKSIAALGEEIVHLDSYIRLNYVGFQKLTQKFDQIYDIGGSSIFVAGLHTEPFCCVRFDDVMILLGLAWARWRDVQSAEQSKDDKWVPPESFIRNTSKYWVRPDKVLLLKTRIVKHLPYLIFGASQTEQEKLLDPFALLELEQQPFDVQATTEAYTGNMEESQLLSSVYFDSPTATSYHERIHRFEGARLVRFRWYGENNLEDDKEVYIERKIHHEGFGSAQSAKERCVLPQKDVLAYMNGQFDIDGFYQKMAEEGVVKEKARRKMKEICHEVNEMIQSKKLQPIIRTSYYRCAFQLATNNEVRISLDTQMSLLNEYREGGHKSAPWCHISSDMLQKNEVYRFPFAILEIKLQNVSETPMWLKQTLADIEAIQVHKFSKFQHAMAFLHPEKVPLLPHWHQDFKEWHEKKERAFNYSAKQKLTVAKALSSKHDDLMVPEIRAPEAPAGVGHYLKDMQNLDPKGIFANERTLLHYAEKGMYTGALAVVLLYQPTSVGKFTGAVLSVSTIFFYVWALFEYYSRLGRIVGRSKVGKNTQLRLDWVHGPLIVGAVIMIVLAISLVEGLRKSMEEKGSQ